MQRLVQAAMLFWLIVLTSACSDGAQSLPCASPIPYGNNPAAAHYANVNGIRLYYEIYGNGPPLLVMHGNGGSIRDMACQIAFFAPTHTVIAVDGRGRGNSEDGDQRYTFELQADDFAALLDHEHIDKADLLGHSDGGIIALELGLRHPDKVRKIVASAPNLWPDSTALYPEVIDQIKQALVQAKAKLAAGDTSHEWGRYQRELQQDLDEPHLTLKQMQAIKAPTLLIGAENDAIRPEHLHAINDNLPHGQLVFIAGSTHVGLVSTPEFNQLASQFFGR